MDKKKPDGIVLTEAQKKSRRQRSIAIALALGVLVVLFFAVTIVKGPAVLVRPMGSRGTTSQRCRKCRPQAGKRPPVVALVVAWVATRRWLRSAAWSGCWWAAHSIAAVR